MLLNSPSLWIPECSVIVYVTLYYPFISSASMNLFNITLFSIYLSMFISLWTFAEDTGIFMISPSLRKIFHTIALLYSNLIKKRIHCIFNFIPEPPCTLDGYWRCMLLWTHWKISYKYWYMIHLSSQYQDSL